MIVLGNARVVTPSETLSPGWVEVAGDRIVAVGSGGRRGARAVDLRGSWLVPGFVDVHVHGGGGAAMASADADEIRRAAAFHRGHGTTRLLASLVTAPVADMEAAASAVADVVEAGPALDCHVVGCHLEGPFLSRARCGAQDPRWLLEPDLEILDRLLRAGRGLVRVVTLAPELSGGLDLVRQLVAGGVVAAIGHTDATWSQARAAIACGAALATHLFNGMRPLHHREPGAAGAALADERTICELIGDGAHVHQAAARLAFAAAGAGRIALVTDAIPATGAGDGVYQLGSMSVRVEAGVSRVEGGTSLAGSTLTMDRAVRHAVHDLGIPLEDAVTAASTTPARVLGLGNRVGAIETGKEADLVVLDSDLTVAGVLAGGAWSVEP